MKDGRSTLKQYSKLVVKKEAEEASALVSNVDGSAIKIAKASGNRPPLPEPIEPTGIYTTTSKSVTCVLV